VDKGPLDELLLCIDIRILLIFRWCFWPLWTMLPFLCFINMQVSLNDNANNELSHSNPLGTSSAEMVDSKEIDNALDEFSRMLSNYSCDDNPADQVAPSAAQTKLEALFTPPDWADSSPHHSPAAVPCQSKSDSIASAAKGNPSTSTLPAEDEASVR